MTGKRVCLTYEEKLWIINHQAENKEIKQTKIAVDFQAKFKRPVTPYILKDLRKWSLKKYMQPPRKLKNKIFQKWFMV